MGLLIIILAAETLFRIGFLRSSAMGRHLKYPTKDGDVTKESAIGGSAGEKQPNEAVLKRLGFGKTVCMDCNARNPERADACRKCGSSQLREKKHDYRDA